ncbi:MAG: hypothetical protein WAV07_09720 [Candidatus Contendobacter sp.]
MDFEIIGKIRHTETFAQGSSIREMTRLRKFYGDGHWRKRKAEATVRLSDGTVLNLESGSSRSSGIWSKNMASHQFVVCINNCGYEVSLEPRKLYQVLPDSEAAKHHQVRIVDESGDDYLYPESFFLAVPLPERVAEQVAHTAIEVGQPVARLPPHRSRRAELPHWAPQNRSLRTRLLS